MKFLPTFPTNNNLAMPAKCPKCNALVSGPESEQVFPSVVNPRGDEVLTALVRTYKCVCGNSFTTITYLPRPSP